MEYVLWATKFGEPGWKEELITSTTDKEHLERARVWALANGFHRLRVMEYRGEKPDFTGAITKPT
jgi:hypothetical protein